MVFAATKRGGCEVTHWGQWVVPTKYKLWELEQKLKQKINGLKPFWEVRKAIYLPLSLLLYSARASVRIFWRLPIFSCKPHELNSDETLKKKSIPEYILCLFRPEQLGRQCRINQSLKGSWQTLSAPAHPGCSSSERQGTGAGKLLVFVTQPWLI